MSYQQKENIGTIFPNDKKQKETHPDWTGNINVEGKTFFISMWEKKGKKGKFFSVSIKEPYNKEGQPKTFTSPKEDLPL